MNEKPLILACDDDSSVLSALQLSLKKQFEIHTTNSVVQAKALSSRYEYDAAIIDLNYEGQELDGIHLLDHFNKKSPETFLVVLSGDDNVKRAVEATRRKLFAFIHKGENFFDSLFPELNRVIQIKKAKNAQIGNKFLTESPTVLDEINIAGRIVKADSDANILINGESGVGKEYLVQYIGKLKNKKVISTNMACIPKETAESILFGHERGVFTGAIANKIGLIESADGGIFFLDEIGDCSPEIQAKLLRVIAEREVQPLGSNRPRKVNICFMAATHCNLSAMVKAGTFREDLYQRLNTFVLKIPALRDRPQDILLYANTFLNQGGNGDSHFSITQDGIQELLSYSWPGNVRELGHVIKRIQVLSDKTIIDSNSIRAAIQMGRDTVAMEKTVVNLWEDHSKRELLMRSLSDSSGNKRIAAKALGVSVATLYRWIQDCELTHLISKEKQTS